MAKQQDKPEQQQDDKKNRNFIQLYRTGIDSLTELATANSTAFKLMMFLMKNMDGTNALVVSNNALQEILQLSKATICRSVKYLKDSGYICVLKTGTSNAYIVNPELAWTSYEYQKQYCKFSATVLLTSTENAEYLQNRQSFNRFKTIDDDFINSVKANREAHEERVKEIAES